MNAFLQWLRGVFVVEKTAPAQGAPAVATPASEPAWLRLARAEIGTKEIVGSGHNPKVLGYFADAGFPEVRDDETAWCAGFANAMLERAGVTGSKSLAARSFLKWGKAVTKPYPGCIAVFSRGNSSWEGHVGFFIAEGSGGIAVLGGNQSNQVSIASQDASRLLGYREPVPLAKSRTIRASTLQVAKAGLDGAVILDSQEQLLGISNLLAKLGMTVPSYFVLSILASIAIQMVIVWARSDDRKRKGL